MRAMCTAAFGTAAPPVDVYDGDTPQAHRPSIRARAQLLITNPDMLHMSILPVHSTFARFLRKLRYVVVDEGHAYRCERAVLLVLLVVLSTRSHSLVASICCCCFSVLPHMQYTHNNT